MLLFFMIRRRPTPRHSFRSRFAALGSRSSSAYAHERPQPQSPHGFTSQLSVYPGVGGLPPFSTLSVHAPSKPIPASAPISESRPVSDLCALCVSVFSSLSLPLTSKPLAQSVVEGSARRRFSPIPRRIHTYTKSTRNSPGMNTSRAKDLKFFRINTYEKRREGVPSGSRRGATKETRTLEDTIVAARLFVLRRG